MPEQKQSKTYRASDILNEMYGPSIEEEPEQPEVSSGGRKMREGWLPFLGAGAARLGSGWLSGIVGAVPSLVTTPAAAGIGGAGEALAQKIESPDPIDKELLAVESGLSAIPFGRLVRSVKGLAGTALAKQAVANAARLAAYTESGNVLRRMAQGEDALPDTPSEIGFDAATTGLGWYLGKRIPKAFREPDVKATPPSSRLKSGLPVGGSPRAKNPNQLQSEQEAIKASNQLSSVKDAAETPLSADIIEKLKLIDARPASSRLQHMLDEAGEATTPEAQKLMAYEAKLKVRQKQDLINKYRKEQEAAVRKTAVDTEKAHEAANKLRGKEVVDTEKAQASAYKDIVERTKAQEAANKMVADEKRLANAEAAIERAHKDHELVADPPTLTETTVKVPTVAGSQTLKTTLRPKKADDFTDDELVHLGQAPRGAAPIAPSKPVIPKTDPAVVAKTLYPTEHAAMHAAAGSGKRAAEFRSMGKGKWRVIFEEEPVVAPKTENPQAPANAIAKAETEAEGIKTPNYAGPDRRKPTRLAGEAEDAKYRSMRQTEMEKNLQAQGKQPTPTDRATIEQDVAALNKAAAEQKPPTQEPPPAAPVVAKPKPAPKSPSGGATTKPDVPVTITRAEPPKPVATTPSIGVKAGTGSRSSGNSATDARLRKQSAKDAQKAPETPQTPAKGVAAPKVTEPPTEAPKAPEGPSGKAATKLPMSKREIDAVTREDVKNWSAEEIQSARAKFPKDKRLQTILDDELKARTEKPQYPGARPVSQLADDLEKDAPQPAKGFEGPDREPAKPANVKPQPDAPKTKDPVGPTPTRVTVDLSGAKDAKEVKNRVVNELQKYRKIVQKYEDSRGVDEKGKYTYGEPTPAPLTIEVPNGPTYTVKPDLTQIDGALMRFEKGVTAKGASTSGPGKKINPDEAFTGIVDPVKRPTSVFMEGEGGPGTKIEMPSLKKPDTPEPSPTGGGAKSAKKGSIPAKGTTVAGKETKAAPKAEARPLTESKPETPKTEAPKTPTSGKLRDAETPAVFGYELNRDTLTPKRSYLPQRSEADLMKDKVSSMMQRWGGNKVSKDELRAEIAADPKLKDALAKHLDAAPDGAPAYKKAMGLEEASPKPKAEIKEAKATEGTGKLVDLAQKEKDAWDNYFAVKSDVQAGKAKPEDLRAAGKAAGEAKAEVMTAVREAIAKGEPIPTFLQKHADNVAAKTEAAPKAKTPPGKGPTNEDIAKLPPAEQETALKDAVEKFKKSKRKFDETGEGVNELALALGLVIPGAFAGAAITPDDPLTGALIGGGIGLAPAAVFRTLSQHVNSLPAKTASKSKEALSKYVWDRVKVAAEIMPDAYRASLLSKPEGLMINSFVGPYGAAVMGSLERMLAGDKRGKAAFLDLMNPKTFTSTWFSKATREEAKLRVFSNASRADMIGGKGPKALQWLIKQPAEVMTTGDVASKNILMKHGFSELEARQMNLTSEPYGKAISDFVRAGEPSQGLTIMKRMALPFFRTSQNQIEQSFMRAPVLGFMAENLFGNAPRSLKLKLAQQGVGAGVLGVSYALGAVTPKEQRARYAKLLTNFGGPYGTLAAAGFLAGYKSQTEPDIEKQIEAGLVGSINELPLPTGDALTSTGRAALQTVALPFKAALKGELDEKDIPDLPFGFVPPMLSSKEAISVPSAMRDPKGFASDKFRPTQKEYSLLAPFVDKPELKDLPTSASENAKAAKKRQITQTQSYKDKRESRRLRQKEIRNKRRSNELD